MDSKANLADVSAASERFFRFYVAHCESPDLDTLFALLQAGHSLNDRLQKGAGLDFFNIPEFTALKCLRNYFHHHEELRHVVSIFPVGDYPIVTDLLYLCLVPRESVMMAIDQIKSQSAKDKARQACQDVFHLYGQVVNINPALFNFVVAAYERLKEANVVLTGVAVEKFEQSYRYEEENGFSHVINGKLETMAGSVDDLLANIMRTRGLSRSG
ncbi:hypothetical protein [Xanthobacter autotrophicus]|uniref:hypothetical protein n=1 Tax=Xanthobacter autotrophicus TaxID=280 RepID=UPI00372ADE65